MTLVVPERSQQYKQYIRHHLFDTHPVDITFTFPFSSNRSAGWAGKNFTDNDTAELTVAVPTAVASYFTQDHHT